MMPILPSAGLRIPNQFDTSRKMNMVEQIGKKRGAQVRVAVWLTRLSSASISASTTFCSPPGRSFRLRPTKNATSTITALRMNDVSSALVTRPRPISSATTSMAACGTRSTVFPTTITATASRISRAIFIDR